MNKKVSIIMRTKDCDWVVDQALASLFSQDFKNFELIIVDSGSTDRTLKMINNYPCQLIEIKADDYFPSKVLNMAIEKSRGEIIVFQNSDVVMLKPDTLTQLLKPFHSPQTQASFARQLVRPEAQTWVKRDYALSFPEKETPSWLPFSLPLAAMRRSSWKQHPFYSQAWGSEDTEWGVWAKKHHHQVVYAPQALVMHSHNYTLKQLYSRCFIEGEADAFIYQRNSSLSFSLKQCVGKCLRDLIYYCQQGDFRHLITIPFRRLIGSWGYYRGHRWGNKRRLTNNSDLHVGQQVVLSNYA